MLIPDHLRHRRDVSFSQFLLRSGQFDLHLLRLREEP